MEGGVSKPDSLLPSYVAIARAGDGPAEPKSTVSTGGRGEPRALMLSGKGAPTVWTGTSTGEVLVATAVRKAAL